MVGVLTYPDAEAAAKAAASQITQTLIQHKDAPVLFLVSGGSPLEILKHLSPEGFDGRVTVGVSDERFSRDPLINNFSQMIATDWYKEVSQRGVLAIDTRPASGELLEEMGVRFDGALKRWRTEHPTGKIVITQGIGLDGHTAGMMPAYAKASAGKPLQDEEPEFDRLFNNPNIWAVGYDATGKNKYPLRVTTTIPFLTTVDISIVYVCGPDKAKPLSAIFASREDIPAVPGRIIHQMPHCLLYTDQSIDTLK